jgi:hypothetical protein
LAWHLKIDSDPDPAYHLDADTNADTDPDAIGKQGDLKLTVKVRNLLVVEEEKREQVKRNSPGKELKELMVKGERKRGESRREEISELTS